jgi:triosephosphate isomerase (TIM)
MRVPIIAGNWKMNMTPQESVEYAQALIPNLAPFTNVELVVCPTFVALAGVAEALRGTNIKVGAQNVSFNEKGAYTSQIAPNMLKGLAEYVILGHSEVRQYLHETDEDINRKVFAVLGAGMKPIVAVGESHKTRVDGGAEAWVVAQVRAALNGLSAEIMPQVVIAYEPIWAIGTGLNADGITAQAIIGTIRHTLAEMYSDEVAAAVRIQYGGSATPANMQEFMQQADIDGGLVGGASLKLADFTTLVQIAANNA